jgi:autotransporter-associated beta strand protein
MKNTSVQIRVSVLLSVVSAIALFSTSRACAATNTWTGQSGVGNNWSDSANWSTLSAPSANDRLFFDDGSGLRTNPTNDYAPGTIFNQIEFNGSTAAFTLAGNAIILTNGADPTTAVASGGSVINNSPNVQTINMPLTLAAGNHFFSTAGGGQLTLSALSRNANSTLQFGGSGPVNFTGSPLSLVNGILGGWAIFGNDWATYDGSSNIVAYASYTDVNTGVVPTGSTVNYRYINDTGNLTNNAGITINSLLAQQGTSGRFLTNLGANVLKITPKGGIYRNGAATGGFSVLGGPVTVAGGGEMTLGDASFSATANNLTIGSVIANDGANAVSVDILGYVVLNGANTFTGGLYLNQGRVQSGATGGLGPSGGNVYIAAGAEAFLNASGTFAQNFFITGIGATETSGGQNLGAIRCNQNNQTLSGTITLVGNARISGGSGNVNIITGKITGPGRLELTASTGNNGSINLNNAANDWSGGVLITAASGRQVFLKLAANNQIPDGTGKGDVGFSGVDTARFDLNGFSDTINGLNSASAANYQVANYGTAASTLTLGNNNGTATFGGVVLDGAGTNAAATLSIVKTGTGTQTLTGASSYRGTTTVNGGALVFGTAISFPSVTATNLITVNSNATLDVSAIGQLNFGAASKLVMSNGTVTVALQSVGNTLTTSNLTAIGATNYVAITQIPTISTYPAQFVAIKYTTLNGGLNYGLGGSLPVSPGTPYAGYISNNIANNSVDFVVTAGPTAIKWQGYGGGSPNSAWDTVSPNWITFGGAPTMYSDGVFAFFDDTSSNAVVTLSQDVLPAGITVTNSALIYTINGGSKISGTGSLLKQGAGTLILDNSGANDFGGGVSIAAGTLQIGSNDTGTGTIPGSSTVIDNGALAFNRNDDFTVPNIISGAGTVAQNGTDIVTLNGVNTFSGAATITQGTFKLGNSSALGTTNGGTFVTNSGTLDIGANAINIGNEPVTISGAGVSGNGALVNNSGSATFVGPNLARLTLAGDATVGGSGRLDLRSASTGNPALVSLNTGGQPRKLIKVGGNQFTLVGATVDPALGDIVVQGGSLGVETATTGLGNSASNFIVQAGAGLELFDTTNRLNKVFSLTGDGTTVTVAANSSAVTIIGPMGISNDCIINLANKAGVSLIFSNVLTGQGLIHRRTGTNILNLAGNSPDFAGGALVEAGNLTISGTLSNNLGVHAIGGGVSLTGVLLGAGLTNDPGTFIVASGTNTGATDVSGGLSPGAVGTPATFTSGPLIVEGSANLTNDLAFTTTVGGGVNDLIVVNGDLTFNGGTLYINPLGLLQTTTGTKYRLMNYTGALNMNTAPSFPSVLGYNFTLDTSTTNQINLQVSGGPPVWNGGSATDSNWSSSDNWSSTALTPNSTPFFLGPNRLNNTNDTPPDTSYGPIGFVSGAGAFVLNGNPITPVGSINNNSSNPQTIDLGLDFNANFTVSGNSNSIILGGGLTNIAGAATTTTITLAGTGALTNLLASVDPGATNILATLATNANWTLVDNSASVPMTNQVQLDMQAGTLTFGQSGSAPTLVSTTALNNSRLGVIGGAPATFNMVNGSLTIAARLNTGTAANSIATLNQSGGTLNIQSLFQSADGAATATSTVNVSGGVFSVGATETTPAQFFLCSRGTGTVNISLSGKIRCSTLDVSRNIGTTVGTVNLNGGLLDVTRVSTATSAANGTQNGSIALFNFNGGTLRARASSTTFFQGSAASPSLPVTAIVKSGGAIIDSDTNAITVVDPMLHDSSLGVTADGGLKKLGVGTLSLSGANTYTGPTTVSNGTLAVNGSITSPVTVQNGGTLAGSGSVNGTVTVNSGASITPGAVGVIGTLTASSNITLNGTTIIEVNKSSGLNDFLVSSSGSITYGGTLSVTNLAGSYANGDAFKIFDATNYTGSFTITPALPATGFAWDTSTLNTDGRLRIVATVNTGRTNLTVVSSGNFLTISWPADHTGWRLQAQTNPVTTGLLSNWFDVPGSTTTNQVVMPVNPANGSVFYRMVYP